MADAIYDLLVEALTDLGVLADGETPSASQAQGALSKLNSMLDMWNVENLMVYGSTAYSFPIVPGQSVYTVGAGGNFTVPRSAKIQAIYLRDMSLPTSNQMDQLIWSVTDSEWQSVPFKNMTGGLPQIAWLNESYPLATLTINPLPNTGTYNIVIWASGILGNLGLYDLVSLPPGYREAIVANLVIRLAPSYQLDPSQITVNLAYSGKDTIRANNLQSNVLQIDPRLLSYPSQRFNILGGNW